MPLLVTMYSICTINCFTEDIYSLDRIIIQQISIRCELLVVLYPCTMSGRLFPQSSVSIYSIDTMLLQIVHKLINAIKMFNKRKIVHINIIFTPKKNISASTWMVLSLLYQNYHNVLILFYLRRHALLYFQIMYQIQHLYIPDILLFLPNIMK